MAPILHLKANRSRLPPIELARHNKTLQIWPVRIYIKKVTRHRSMALKKTKMKLSIRIERLKMLKIRMSLLPQLRRWVRRITKGRKVTICLRCKRCQDSRLSLISTTSQTYLAILTTLATKSFRCSRVEAWPPNLSNQQWARQVIYQPLNSHLNKSRLYKSNQVPRIIRSSTRGRKTACLNSSSMKTAR